MADGEDFEDLIARHQGYVRAIAIRMAPEPQVADDVCQQVFLEFIAKRERWDLSRDVKPLLAEMTRHVARRAWRSHIAAARPALAGLAEHIRQLAEASGPDEWYGDAEREALRLCMDKLPERSRELMEVHYVGGFSSVELARRMAMNADAVRRALFRLRERLRACIETRLAEAGHD